MKNWLFLILLPLFMVSSAYAELSALDKSYVPGDNKLANGGFEAGRYGWTCSGGTCGTTTTADNVYKGSTAGYFNANAAGQIFRPQAVAVGGLKGTTGEATCYVQTPSGSATYLFEVTDGTNVLASRTVTSSTTYTAVGLLFPFPSSGSVYPHVKSVASDEPLVYIDECRFGPPTRLSEINATTGWTSWTPTFGFTGGSITAATSWRQDGPELVARGKITFTSVFTGGTASMTLPSTCTIDTTIASGGAFGWAQFNDIGTDNFPGYVVYLSNSSVIFRVPIDDTGAGTQSLTYGAVTTTAPFTWANNDTIEFEFRVPCVQFRNAQAAYRPDQVAWRVDANISGANASLGTTSVSSYTEITNGSLTLTNKAGPDVIAAQIPCSGTNASSGTICTSGNESVGVSFNLPVAGSVKACAAFTYQGFPAATAGSNIYAGFQIVETPNSAQTILQEGGDRVNNRVWAISSANYVDERPNRVCGTFSFASAGQKTLRLMYEQEVTGTPQASIVVADGASSVGQRDIHWTVEPISQQTPAPLLVNSVVAPDYAGVTRINTISSKSANYTATDADETLVFTSDATLTLPAAASVKGKKYHVIASGTSTDITIDPNSSEQVCGRSTIAVSGTNDSVTIQSDGSAWWDISGQNCEKVIRAGVSGADCSASPCTLNTSTPGVSITRSATGTYSASFPAFSSEPTCQISHARGSSFICALGTISTNSAAIFCYTDAGASVDSRPQLTCRGTR